MNARKYLLKEVLDTIITPDKLVEASLLFKVNLKHKAVNYEDSLIIKANLLVVARKIMGARLNFSRPVSEDDADATGKVCLAITYLRPNWTDCDESFQMILLTSIARYNQKMSVDEAKRTLHALAHLGVPIHAPRLLHGYDKRHILHPLLNIINEHIDLCDKQMHANMLWSLAALDCKFEEISDICYKIMHKIYEAYLIDNSLPTYHDFDIKQLRDFLANYGDAFPATWQHVVVDLIACFEGRLQVMDESVPVSSLLHRDIDAYFKKYAESYYCSEYRIAGGYADICFPIEKIVFEIYGPHHHDKNGIMDAKTSFRRRIMKKCGYRAFLIDYRDWQEAVDKDEFIIDNLLNAGLTVKQPEADVGTSVELPNLKITIENPVVEAKVVVRIPSDLWIPIKRPQNDERYAAPRKRSFEEMKSDSSDSADESQFKQRRIDKTS
jgi:hypothetical protein